MTEIKRRQFARVRRYVQTWDEKDAILALIAFVLAVLLVVTALSRPARAHGDMQWIQDGGYKSADGTSCCGPSDCVEAEINEFEEEPGGWRYISTGQLVPHASVHPALKGKVVKCRTFAGSGHTHRETVMCLFLPMLF